MLLFVRQKKNFSFYISAVCYFWQQQLVTAVLSFVSVHINTSLHIKMGHWVFVALYVIHPY